MSELLEPFQYQYMIKAISLCALIGGVCAFLSCFLILKGWSLIGDAMAHCVVPGVIIALQNKLPLTLGAFFTGGFAALSMFVLKVETKLKNDVVIGLVFTSFFALGLFLNSLNPVSVNIQGMIMGQILAITDYEVWEITFISLITLGVLFFKMKDYLLIFFDESLAKTQGIKIKFLLVVFFMLLSIMTVAALKTVGACLVIAMMITPGATAYLLVHNFKFLLPLSLFIGSFFTSLGVYLSYFLDASPAGVVVSLQTFVFLLAFTFTLLRRRGIRKRSK